MDVLLVFVLVLIFIYLYISIVKSLIYWKHKRVPCRKSWPILGHMAPFLFRTQHLTEIFENTYKTTTGRYSGFYQFLQPILFIKDLNLIKQLTIKDSEIFLDHIPLITEDIDPFMGKNIFSLTGQKWKRMRTILSPAFTGSKLRSMYTLISQSAEKFTNHFIEESKKSQIPLEVEMKDILSRFANDVIATCGFGVKCNSFKDPNNEFYTKGKDAADFSPWRCLKIFIHSLSPGLMKLFKVRVFDEATNEFFRSLVRKTMRMREKNEIYRPDMIQQLTEAKKESIKNMTLSFSEDDFAAQVLIFFFAGFDSVSTNMCHLIHELAINQHIQKRLQVEIDQAFQDKNKTITFETIIQLKYLDMCVAEGLRKWPPAHITDRICNKSYKIEPERDEEIDLVLETGDAIMISIFSIHRDSKYYPNPDKFDPERFNDENKKHIKQISYAPFGFGPRNCIGARFAVLEIKTALVHILRKFDIVTTEKSQIPLKLKKGIILLHAEQGFWLGLKPRTEK